MRVKTNILIGEDEAILASPKSVADMTNKAPACTYENISRVSFPKKLSRTQIEKLCKPWMQTNLGKAFPEVYAILCESLDTEYLSKNALFSTLVSYVNKNVEVRIVYKNED